MSAGGKTRSAGGGRVYSALSQPFPGFMFVSLVPTPDEMPLPCPAGFPEKSLLNIAAVILSVPSGHSGVTVNVRIRPSAARNRDNKSCDLRVPLRGRLGPLPEREPLARHPAGSQHPRRPRGDRRRLLS